MNSNYMGDTESLKDLESRIPSPDREIYVSFKHMRVESAFIGRVYVIYKPTGLTKENTHRDPEIVGQVRVVEFSCKGATGCEMVVENMHTGQLLYVGHVPKRLFEFDAFIGVPPFSRLRWDGRVSDGRVLRSLAFGILIKTRTRSDYCSAGATMVDSPKSFRSIYPNANLPIRYI